MKLSKRLRASSARGDLTSIGALFRMQEQLLAILASKGKGPLGDGRTLGSIAVQESMGDPSLLIAPFPIELARASQQQALALIMESGEIMDWLPWKTWKASHQMPFQNHESIDAIRREIGVELADVLHFVVNLAMLWNYDANDLQALYEAKNGENRRRALEGY